MSSETVTRENLLAMGAKILGPKRYALPQGVTTIIVDMRDGHTELLVMDAVTSDRVTIAWEPTVDQVQRLCSLFKKHG